jgi:hypothetical protein
MVAVFYTVDKILKDEMGRARSTLGRHTHTHTPFGEGNSKKDTTWNIQKYKKVKALPITGHEGPEGEQRYSSTLS